MTQFLAGLLASPSTRVGVTEALSNQAWAVVWKQDGRAVRDFLLSFGLSTSPEEAMSKVESRLKNDPRFRRDYGGGVFYPVALHINVPVPPAGR
jgi:hypothetical protein